MKAIKVSELKAHLSRYLRLASRGTQILVQDRDEPIAELGPPRASASGWRERMVQEGRLRAGSQAWSELTISKPERPIDIQTRNAVSSRSHTASLRMISLSK